MSALHKATSAAADTFFCSCFVQKLSHFTEENEISENDLSRENLRPAAKAFNGHFVCLTAPITEQPHYPKEAAVAVIHISSILFYMQRETTKLTHDAY